MVPPRKKLALPAALLNELDAREGRESSTGGKGRKIQTLTRKDKRKNERAEKKQFKVQRIQKRQPHRQTHSANLPVQHRHPSTSMKRARGEDDDDKEEEDEFGMDDRDDMDLDEDEDGVSDADSVDETPQHSKAVRRKLQQDDAEIAALEKKLGLKKGKKSKAFDEDGLGELLEGLDSDEEEDFTGKTRKADADIEWLALKRRKANVVAVAIASTTTAAHDDDDSSEMDEDLGDYSDDEDIENDGLSDLGNSDFDDDADELEEGEGDHEDDEDTESAPVRQRENPYVAPTTNVAKYVPPSLRKKSESSSETDAQLRRRMQGLINRLTNENMIGIIKDVSGLHDNYPRQSVTSALVDLLINLVGSPQKRPDGFFTMIAGFAAGAQKALGVHVSANLTQQLVKVFKQHHAQASGDQSDAASKHLIALLAELYNMQVVGPNLIFDYVRLFLGDISELNTELLLRIIQTCGPNLRRDDPHSLKDIVNQVKPGNLKNVSVRTSFMIEEMKKLQKDKSKAASRNKDLAEQRTQIRKRIGILSGAREMQPLGMNLKEIENADKHGKWWVVGASWSGNKDDNRKDDTMAAGKQEVDDSADLLGDDDDLGIPDLWQLAKQQGFNTEVRQRIFVALHAAADYENAELLIRKLRLNRHQKKEIPEVIVRSGERQAESNRFYWLVASRFCEDRELAFQFKRSLTLRFRKMGEDIDTGDDFDAEDGEDYDTRWIHNTGRFYASLVANGSLGLDILKYRNLAALQEKAQWFIEVFFITLLQQAGPEMLPGIFARLPSDMGRGVQYFLKKYIKKTDLLKSKDGKKALKKQCNAAIEILEASLAPNLMETAD